MKGLKPNQMKITKARHVLMCLRLKNEASSRYAEHVAEQIHYLEVKRAGKR